MVLRSYELFKEHYTIEAFKHSSIQALKH